jgi:hypothetical protein
MSVVYEGSRVRTHKTVNTIREKWDNENTNIFLRKTVFENNKESVSLLINASNLEAVLIAMSDEELQAIIEFMEDNLFTLNNNTNKYMVNNTMYLTALRMPSQEKIIQTYFKLRAEQILREIDKEMISHYKSWLEGNKPDITDTINKLSNKNVELVEELSNKFNNSAFGFKFFIGLVNTNKIWDIKNRELEVSLFGSEIKTAKNKVGEGNYKEVRLYTNDKDNPSHDVIASTVYSKDYIFNEKERARDYYGNFHYGYVGMEYIKTDLKYLGLVDSSNWNSIDFTSSNLSQEVLNYIFQPLLEEKALSKQDILIKGANLAQILSNALQFKIGGDPPQDIEAVKDGINSYKNKK